MENEMKKLILFVLALVSFLSSHSQEGTGEMIDKVVGVVGDEIILYSEIEISALQSSQGQSVSEDVYCTVMEEILFEKMLLNQAKIDSLEISNEEVLAEIERRLGQYIQLFGSEENMVEYYGKSINEWREEFKEPVEKQLLAELMKNTLFGNIRVTPGEVREYFNSVPKDSLPLINATLEYSMIKYDPVVSEEEVDRVIHLLDSIRLEMLAMDPGAIPGKFAVHAALLSEDPGSKYKGGCYPLQTKGSFVPEYESAVFNTPIKSITPVFESQYGYHIVYVKDVRGQNYETCHILVSPKASENDMKKAEDKIQEIYEEILTDSISFNEAVLEYSSDERTKYQKGRVLSQYSGSSKLDHAELDQNIFFILDQMEEGDMSEPVFLQPQGESAPAWYILRLDKRNPAHEANLEQDYQIFKSQAEKIKKKEELDDWVEEKILENYIWIDDIMNGCSFNFVWVQNE